MKISQTLLAKEAAKRGLRKELLLDPAFPKQNAFIEDTSRFLTAQCTRRAGKTNALAIRFFKTLEKHPKAQCLYLCLTRESAERIMWPVLKELDAAYNLGCIFSESRLTMKYPNGSMLRLLGADMKNFVMRLKGIKTPGVAIDEAQDFSDHLQSLVDDVLTPAMADYTDSWLAITGTPGPVPKGYFYDITKEQKYGYTAHEWTLYENIYLPNPTEFVEEIKRKRQWDDRNPTYLREYQNQWVLDVESLWIKYNQYNDYRELPNGKWNYILGIDLGYKDADALAVLAWNEVNPCTYLVEEIIVAKQGITELVNTINSLQSKYDISKLIIDQGGLGLKIAEELRRRHHIPVVGAEKQRKQETVAFLNDALRTKRLAARSSSRFAQDSYLIQIDWDKTTPDRIVTKKGFHSDIIDAVLYAFKESPAYAYQVPVEKPKYKSEQWYEAEVSDMEQQAIDHFTALEQAEEDPYSDY